MAEEHGSERRLFDCSRPGDTFVFAALPPTVREALVAADFAAGGEGPIDASASSDLQDFAMVADLPDDVLNLLENTGVGTLGELLANSRRGLCRSYRCPPGTIEVLEDALSRAGLSLRSTEATAAELRATRALRARG